MSLHASYTLNPTGLKTTGQKLHKQPLLRLDYDWIPIVFHSEGYGASSFVNPIQQTAHYSTQNESFVPLFVKDVVQVLKKRFRELKSQKASSIKNILHVTATQNELSFIEP